MATNTTNYNLIKPTDNEFAEISVINANMDIIDTGMKTLDNSKEALVKNTTEKTTLADADALPLIDSADSSKTKKLSFVNLKILLKTIFATTEDISALNTSLSNTIKKDGSVQMTGALKTVGTNGAQIKDTKNSICTYNDYYFLCSNCYYDGTNWRYLNDGLAMNLNVRGTNGFCSQSVYASGLKDAICTGGVSTELMTKATGLPLTGGTLTGNIDISNTFPGLNLRDTNTPTEYSQFVLDASTLYLQNVKSGAEFSNICLFPYTTPLSSTLRFYKSGYGDYKIYGEHNITVSTVAPSSALAEGAQHQVY